MSDRPTLKSVTDRLDEIDARVGRLSPKDPESDVISRCAKALDDLMRGRDDRRSGYTSGTSTNYTLSFNAPHYYDVSHPVARVLDYLRQRHGLPNPAAEVERLRLENGELYERLRVAESKAEAMRHALDGPR